MHTTFEPNLSASTQGFLLSLNLNIGIASSDINSGSLCGHCMDRQRSVINVVIFDFPINELPKWFQTPSEFRPSVNFTIDGFLYGVLTMLVVDRAYS
jgi:hypothetical protein